MSLEFKYIIDKIQDAEFFETPFKHIYIENLLSDTHLDMLKNSDQIKLPLQSTTEELITLLQAKGYKQQSFSGCTDSIKSYLEWYNNQSTDNLFSYHNSNDSVEGFGMAWRLQTIQSPEIISLRRFLNSNVFHLVLKEKFELHEPTNVTTAIHKYLTGYEISPHPDIRSKALTYLININTEEETEGMDIHTHLLRFKSEHSSVYEFWQKNTNVERCWVPWDWCNTEKTISKNNSLIMFSPGNDTLHGVKLNYNHLLLQRTQFYGNVWFTGKTKRRVRFPVK